MGKKEQSSIEAVVADRPAGDSAAIATAEASATSLATQPAVADGGTNNAGCIVGVG